MRKEVGYGRTLVWAWACSGHSRCPPSLAHCRSGCTPPDCRRVSPDPPQPPGSGPLDQSPGPAAQERQIINTSVRCNQGFVIMVTD